MWRLWQGLNAETIRRVLCDLQLVMGAAQPCCCEETQPKAQDELDARAFRFHSSGFLFPQGQSTVDLNRFNCLRFEIFIEFQWSWNISPGSYCQGIVMLIFEQRTKILMMLQEEADSKWFNDSKSVDVLAFLEYTVHYLWKQCKAALFQIVTSKVWQSGQESKFSFCLILVPCEVRCFQQRFWLRTFGDGSNGWDAWNGSNGWNGWN